MSSTPPEHRSTLEDLEFLADTCVGLTAAAQRTGFTDRRHLDKWLRRQGQDALLARLIKHDVEPVTTSRKAR